MNALIILCWLAACAHPIPASTRAETPAELQLHWLLDVLTHSGRVDDVTFRAHFAHPTAAIRDALPGLAAHLQGMTIRTVDKVSPTRVALHGSVKDTRFVLTIVVEADQITDLQVAADEGPRPTSYADAISKLQQLAPHTNLLVAELEHGRCTQLVAHESQTTLAIASTFKLYVLLAIEGAVGWDDEIVVRDDWKSLPSGITQNDPAGTKLTIRTLAERMISISDNTAADMLLYTLGRERVEAVVRSSGHASPQRNVPFLATRELFYLKLALWPNEIARYLALEPAARRDFLATLAGKRPATEDWTDVRAIDTIEWYASADDLCRLAAQLVEHGTAILDVLAKNPVLEPSPDWSYAGFKGGSEPGVINATWILRRRDGRWFSVTIGLNAEHPIDEGAALGIGHGVIDLLANH